MPIQETLTILCLVASLGDAILPANIKKSITHGATRLLSTLIPSPIVEVLEWTPFLLLVAGCLAFLFTLAMWVHWHRPALPEGPFMSTSIFLISLPTLVGGLLFPISTPREIENEFKVVPESTSTITDQTRILLVPKINHSSLSETEETAPSLFASSLWNQFYSTWRDTGTVERFVRKTLFPVIAGTIVVLLLFSTVPHIAGPYRTSCSLFILLCFGIFCLFCFPPFVLLVSSYVQYFQKIVPYSLFGGYVLTVLILGLSFPRHRQLTFFLMYALLPLCLHRLCYDFFPFLSNRIPRWSFKDTSTTAATEDTLPAYSSSLWLFSLVGIFLCLCSAFFLSQKQVQALSSLLTISSSITYIQRNGLVLTGLGILMVAFLYSGWIPFFPGILVFILLLVLMFFITALGSLSLQQGMIGVMALYFLFSNRNLSKRHLFLSIAVTLLSLLFLWLFPFIDVLLFFSILGVSMDLFLSSSNHGPVYGQNPPLSIVLKKRKEFDTSPREERTERSIVPPEKRWAMFITHHFLTTEDVVVQNHKLTKPSNDGPPSTTLPAHSFDNQDVANTYTYDPQTLVEDYFKQYVSPAHSGLCLPDSRILHVKNLPSPQTIEKYAWIPKKKRFIDIPQYGKSEFEVLWSDIVSALKEEFFPDGPSNLTSSSPSSGLYTRLSHLYKNDLKKIIERIADIHNESTDTSQPDFCIPKIVSLKTAISFLDKLSMFWKTTSAFYYVLSDTNDPYTYYYQSLDTSIQHLCKEIQSTYINAQDPQCGFFLSAGIPLTSTLQTKTDPHPLFLQNIWNRWQVYQGWALIEYVFIYDIPPEIMKENDLVSYHRPVLSVFTSQDFYQRTMDISSEFDMLTALYDILYSNDLDKIVGGFQTWYQLLVLSSTHHKPASGKKVDTTYPLVVCQWYLFSQMNKHSHSTLTEKQQQQPPQYQDWLNKLRSFEENRLPNYSRSLKTLLPTIQVPIQGLPFEYFLYHRYNTRTQRNPYAAKMQRNPGCLLSSIDPGHLFSQLTARLHKTWKPFVTRDDHHVYYYISDLPEFRDGYAFMDFNTLFDMVWPSNQQRIKTQLDANIQESERKRKQYQAQKQKYEGNKRRIQRNQAALREAGGVRYRGPDEKDSLKIMTLGNKIQETNTSISSLHSKIQEYKRERRALSRPSEDTNAKDVDDDYLSHFTCSANYLSFLKVV